ncbi:hypothetical protein P879_06373 [Paragonimus westermani]|uniref:Uncharacterized protein n=1 Tax=Paragonimus westermani TaxID=34504 RepID=A0A8T0D3K0_9TREM|nr:hypothetical protein P879_06373 [Paragonimus westermani]
MAEFIRKIHGTANELQKKHMALLEATDKMKSEQSSCLQSAKHCRTYIQFLLKEIAKIDKSDDSVDQKKLISLRDELQRKEILLRDVDDSLPRSPGIYLRIVLGALNISFLNKQDKYAHSAPVKYYVIFEFRFAYKNDYEQFKIVVSGISAVLTFLLYFFIKSSVTCIRLFLAERTVTHEAAEGDPLF